MKNDVSKIVSKDELDAFSAFIKAHFNYDFSNYASSSLSRRIARIIEQMRLPNTQELINAIRLEPDLFEFVLRNISVNVTEMFRDPKLWLLLRNKVLPDIIGSKNKLNIWHCGCSSGQEVYSTKILLDEVAPHKQVNIKATDFDQSIISLAEGASYPNKEIKKYQNNYLASAGKDFAKHFEFNKDSFTPISSIRSNIKFERHDLVTDEPILDTFDIIFCRNIFIYFNQKLQDHVLNKLYQSLSKKGLLIIGAQESIFWCRNANKFRAISSREKIFQRID